MQKDLITDLLDKQQRETAGSSSSLRFDYQKNWAFCEMLRRHMLSADYLVAFEFHDDVVFLEPASAPRNVDFIQVKTSGTAKPKKLASLLYRKKQANSILGKMCMNFEGICASHEVRLILVSNVAFEFADKDVRISDIETKYRATIAKKLKAEIPSLTDSQLEKLHFMIAGVSLDAIQTYLDGKAMELFKSRFGENHGHNVHSWVRLVQGEINRKNNYSSDKITNVEELIREKCISRAEVIETLNVVASSKTAPNWELIAGELRANGYATAEIIRLNKYMPQATCDYTDATNTDAQNIVAAMVSHFDGNSQLHASIGDYVRNVVTMLKATLSHPYNNESYLGALAILVFHEKI